MKNIRVVCTETGEIFDSIGKASRKFGISPKQIAKSIRNKNYTTNAGTCNIADKLHWEVLNPIRYEKEIKLENPKDLKQALKDIEEISYNLIETYHFQRKIAMKEATKFVADILHYDKLNELIKHIDSGDLEPKYTFENLKMKTHLEVAQIKKIMLLEGMIYNKDEKIALTKYGESFGSYIPNANGILWNENAVEIMKIRKNAKEVTF